MKKPEGTTSTEWFSARTLKEMSLPGLPGSIRAIQLKSNEKNWESRERQGRGGGFEYHIDSLPAETRAAIKLRTEEKTDSGKQSSGANQDILKADKPQALLETAELWKHYEGRPQKARDEAAKRLKAVQTLNSLVESGEAKMESFNIVAEQLGVSHQSVRRWCDMVENYHPADWLAVLVPKYSGRTKEADISDDAWEFFKGDYLRLERPALSVSYERTKAAAKKHGWDLPSQKTLERKVKREIPHPVIVLKRQGEKALQRLYPALERDKSMLKALEWINGDGYLHNVFVNLPDGTIFRPKTWFWQDVGFNMILGYRTDMSENTDMIRLACLDVFERWGLPDNKVTIDNTRAAANKWMTGGIANRFRFKVKDDDPLGILPGLGLDVHWATPGWGQSKPIERAFGVGGLGEYVDKHPLLAGAWCGDNPMAKPENYASKAVDFETFKKALSEGVAMWNAKEKRRTEACRGIYSFEETFLASYKTSVIRKLTDEQRRLFLLTAEAIKVGRDGTFKMESGKGFGVGDNRYGDDRLLNYIGQKLVVRFDPQQLHEPVHCYTLSGQYICQAECILAAGFGDTQRAREHTKARRQKIKATKLAAQAESRMTALETAELLPAVEPQHPEPPQVVKPTFGKRVVNSDYEDNGGYSDHFDRAVDMFRQQQKNKL